IRFLFAPLAQKNEPRGSIVMARSTPPASPQSNIPIDIKEISPESESCPKPKSPEFHSDLRKDHTTATADQARPPSLRFQLADILGPACGKHPVPCTERIAISRHHCGGDNAHCCMPANTTIAAPSMMAMSATLKMPVRTEPSPTFRKSTTLPEVR